MRIHSSGGGRFGDEGIERPFRPKRAAQSTTIVDNAGPRIRVANGYAFAAIMCRNSEIEYR